MTHTQDQTSAGPPLAEEARYPAVRRYTITLDGGGEASFGYCGKEPLTEDFLRAMKAIMEAAAEEVRRDGLPDNAIAQRPADENQSKTTP